nr:MAG TPA: hypothetical protein [Caudoviricetes sp.]
MGEITKKYKSNQPNIREPCTSPCKRYYSINLKIFNYKARKDDYDGRPLFE